MDANQYSILLVEDDPFDVRLIKRAFAKANINYPLHVLQDGEAAVEFLRDEINQSDYNLQPALMLLDLKLPRKSGLEVLSWIRKQEKIKRLPIVILTASKDNAEINKAYDLGVNCYLVKPVEFNDLLEMVKTLNMHWLVLNEKPEI
jgi:CheY-like chemotaxis protein